MYILNFAVTLYTLQLDAHTVVPFLYGQWSGLDEESSHLQPIGSRILQSLITNKIQMKRAYHTHSSFLAKYHIHGIVAMLDLSNVEKVQCA